MRYSLYYKLRWYREFFVLMDGARFFYSKEEFMLIQVLLLIVGFIILIKGADVFVDGASNLARNFKLSKMFVGLTIVAFGTSAPELAVSIKSMISGSGEIVLGNVIGSNILNILLILGCSSLVHDLTVKNATVKKELPITLLLTSLLIVLMSDKFLSNQPNLLDRGDGITILLVFLVFIAFLGSSRRPEPSHLRLSFSKHGRADNFRDRPLLRNGSGSEAASNVPPAAGGLPGVRL